MKNIIITEAQYKRLMEIDESDEQLEQIIELFKSGSDVNIQLALQLIKGLGFNKPDLENKLKAAFGDLVNAVFGSHNENDFLKTFEKLFTRKSMSMFQLGDRVPEEIGILTGLRNLSIYGNKKLTQLPDTIGNLTNLEHLRLNNNALTSIPDSIGNLTQLKKLALMDNNLKTLPDTIRNLTNLRLILMGGNPIEREEIQRLKKVAPHIKISMYQYK